VFINAESKRQKAQSMKKFWILNKINPNTAEILLYGYISQYDVSAADFIIELSQLANTYNDITIRINSGGGSVFEGLAIYNAIKSMQKNGKRIATSIDGIAASMGGVIAVAGNPVKISKYGRIMTHEASGGASGTAEQMRQQAQLVEDANKDIVNIFAARTGLTEEQAKNKFFKPGVDNWMNAAKCVELHLADEVYDADPVPVPEDVTDEKQLHNIFETCLNKSIPQIKNTNMKSIAKLLGLPEDATETQIENALKDALAAKKTAEDAITNIAKTRAESLVNDAITAKKITADKKDMFVTNAIANYDATKAMLDLIPATKKPTEIINQQTPNLGADDTDSAVTDVTGNPGEGWDNLAAKGVDAVAKCKKETPEVYAKLYKDKYKRDPSQMGFRKD
jgi:ATP-dependent Clp endopeptidase proteolytic subunit ClpP